MSTNGNHGDTLRNPAVDYDRTDLSARGILLFLAGLLVAGIFIELVIWGMFRFLSHSTLFAQGNPSPLVQVQTVGQEKAPGAKMQNTGQVDTQVFPQPRLQTNDVADMNDFLQREKDILYPEQPFEDSAGTVHIPISQAMALIVERGLPVRPSTPPRDFNTQTGAENASGAGVAPSGNTAGAAQGAKPGPNQ